MKYEDIQKLRTKYRQDPEVINIEDMRNVAVRCGNFKKAFELQEKLEDIWFNYLKEYNERSFNGWSNGLFLIILVYDSSYKNK